MLTENLILQKTKQSDIRHVRKLNVCGVELSDINVLANASNLEVCSLSVNKISTLEPLANCHRLQELYLRKNSISDLGEIFHLSGLRHLRYLWLADNPCCTSREYRSFIIRALPQLLKLDDEVITEEERQATESPRAKSVVMSPRRQPEPQYRRHQEQPHHLPAHQQPQQQPYRSVRPLTSDMQPRNTGAHYDHPGATHYDPMTSAQPESVAPRRSSINAARLSNAYNGDDMPVGGRPSSRPQSTRTHTADVGIRSTASPPAVPSLCIPVTGPKSRSSSPPHSAHVIAAPTMHERGSHSYGGPKEEAVFRAVLTLLGELSPAALFQVKGYVDERLKR